MKTMLKVAILIAMIALLSGCAGEIQYRDKYAIMTPNDSLTQDTPVPPPPYKPQEYAKLSCDAKESMWTQYTTDLLGVISVDRANLAGIRAWKSTLQQKVDELNAQADKK